MKEKYCLIITTYADEDNGKKIIDTLLTERLAACVQVMPIQSYYHWQGEIANDAEKLLLIKTKSALYTKVEKAIIAHHAYELPEVIQLPISAGFSGYLNWLDKECG
ncbi:MAG: divalent-cation tolerance protein CutA [Candidatus Electrothrix communis]|nr:divalent-cation tolerance protein CutA [Desulfobulbus sp. US4]WLE97867.1 MAG: divalent-cation tolerance protein CutA [Candidatus Electrothrix communis]